MPLFRSLIICLSLSGPLAAAALFDNITNYYTAADGSRSDTYVSNALSSLRYTVSNFLTHLRSDGSFDDVGTYSYTFDASCAISMHYAHIFRMAQAYSTFGTPTYYKNASLLTNIEKALGYVYSNWTKPSLLTANKSAGNWWFWGIGIPYADANFGATILLMRSNLSATAYAQATNALSNLMFPLNTYFTTGQNLVWISMTYLYWGLITGNTNWLTQAKNNIESVCVVDNNVAHEGIMGDYSFHQHGTQIYNGGYGGTFADSVSIYFLWADGTPYALGASPFSVYIDYIAEANAWMTYNKFYDIAVISREVTRASESAGDLFYASLRLANIAHAKQPFFTARAKELLTYFNGGYSLESASLVNPVKLSPASSSAPTGHRHYPFSDYTLHRGTDYFMSVKMFSSRIIPYEVVNHEGKKSWHLSDGVTWILTAGDEYMSANQMPAMDWNRLPGITVEKKSLTALNANANGPKGALAFTGGAFTPEFGVSCMDYDANDTLANNVDLRAKKSWFFFKDMMVCVGSGISCPTANITETVINQRPLPTVTAALTVDGIAKPVSDGWTETMTNVRWMQSDNIGYFFPSAATVKAVQKNQSGAWSDIGASADTAIYTYPFLTLYFDHGANASNASYAYAVLPRKSSAQMVSFAAASSLVILAQSTSTHAVKETNSNAAGFVFWAAGSCDKVAVDKPCAVFYACSNASTNTYVTITLAEPARVNATVKLTWRGIIEPVGPLPSGVSITSNATNTILTYTTANGLSYAATFIIRDDGDAPDVTGARTSFTTNKPFQITLHVSKNFGYWSTNGGAFTQFSTNGTTFWVSNTATLRCCGLDLIGNMSATNTYVYTFDTAPPVITVSHTNLTTNAPFTVTMNANENFGYWSTNGSVYRQLTTTGTNFIVYRTTALSWYGRDALGNNGSTNTRTYTFTGPVLTPPVITAANTAPLALESAMNIIYTADKGNNPSYTVGFLIRDSAGSAWQPIVSPSISGQTAGLTAPVMTNTWKIGTLDSSKRYDLCITIASGILTGDDVILTNVDISRLFLARENVEQAAVIGSPYRGGTGMTFVNLPGDASARIYSVSGKMVAAIAAGNDASGKLMWDMKTTDGRSISPGVYLVQLNAASGIKVLRVMVIASH